MPSKCRFPREENSEGVPNQIATSLLVPFSGITVFPEDEKQQDVDRLTKNLEKKAIKKQKKN